MAIARRRNIQALIGQQMLLEEFLKLPEFKPALELVDGRVTQKVAPLWLHGWLQLELGALFNRHARPLKLAAAFTETREAAGCDSLVPDVSVYRWRRLPRTATGRLANARPAPPDIAVEIRSPGQSLDELIDKYRRYLDHGTELAVVVDPDDEIVVLVRPDGGATTLRGDERIDLAPVLPGFELIVRGLFATLKLE